MSHTISCFCVFCYAVHLFDVFLSDLYLLLDILIGQTFLTIFSFNLYFFAFNLPAAQKVFVFTRISYFCGTL